MHLCRPRWDLGHHRHLTNFVSNSRPAAAKVPSSPDQTCGTSKATSLDVTRHRIGRDATASCTHQAPSTEQQCEELLGQQQYEQQQRPTDPQGHYHTSRQLARAIRDAASCQQLLHALQQHSPATFNFIHVTSAATRLATLLPDADTTHPHALAGPASGGAADGRPLELLQLVTQLVLQHIDELDARGAANILWALAKTQHLTHSSPAAHTQVTGVSQALMARCELHCHKFTPQQLCNVLWAAATLDLAIPRATSDALLAAVEQQVSSFTGQGWSMLLWSCAHLGLQPTARTLQALYILPPAQLEGLGPQAIANALWALAHLSNLPGYVSHTAEWIEAVLSHGRAQLALFSPQALANTTWALAKLKHRPGAAWLDSFSAASLPVLPRMSGQQLSNTAWALAKLGYSPSSAWLNSVASTFDSSMAALGQEAFGCGSWALACLGYRPGPAWLASWSRTAEGLLPAATPQSMSSCIHAWCCWTGTSDGDNGCDSASTGTPDHDGSSTSTSRASSTSSSRATNRGASRRASAHQSQWLSAAVIRLSDHIPVGSDVAATGTNTGVASTPCSGSTRGGLGSPQSGLPTAQQHSKAHVRQHWLPLLVTLVSLAKHLVSTVAGGGSSAEYGDVGTASSSDPHETSSSSSGAISSSNSTISNSLQCLLHRAAHFIRLHSADLPAGELVTCCWCMLKLGFRPGADSGHGWVEGVVRPVLDATRAGQVHLSTSEAGMLLRTCRVLGVDGTGAVSYAWLQRSIPPAPAVAGGSAAAPAEEEDGACSTSGSTSSSQRSRHMSGSVAVLLLWQAAMSTKTSEQATPAVFDTAAPSQTSSTSGATSSSSSSSTGEQLPVQRLMQAVAKEADQLSGPELCRALWAAARLGLRPYPWWRHVVQAALMSRVAAGDLTDPTHLSLCIWALAKLGLRPARPNVHKLLVALVEQNTCLRPPDLCRLLWAMTQWKLAVPPYLVDLVWSSLQPEEEGGHQQWQVLSLAQAVKHVRLQHLAPPPAVLGGLQRHVSQLLEEPLSNEDVALISQVMLLTCIQQRQQPPCSSTAAVSNQHAGSDPSKQNVAWLGQAIQQVQQQLPQLDLRQCAVVLNTLGQCRGVADRQQVDQLLDSFLIVTTARVPTAPTSHLLAVLRACQVHKLAPDPAWKEAMLAAWQRRMHMLSIQELLACLPALAAGHCGPDPRWLSAYLGRVARLIAERPVDERAVAGVTAALVQLDPQLKERWLQQLAVIYVDERRGGVAGG